MHLEFNTTALGCTGLGLALLLALRLNNVGLGIRVLDAVETLSTAWPGH